MDGTLESVGDCTLAVHKADGKGKGGSMVSMPHRLACSCIVSVRYSAVAPEGSLLGLPAEHVRDRLEATYRSVRGDLGTRYANS